MNDIVKKDLEIKKIEMTKEEAIKFYEKEKTLRGILQLENKEKDEVYQLYQDKINFTGFHKVWLNQTWKQVHQDVYTEENKNYYLFKRNSHSGSTNGRAKLTEEDVYQIRLRRKNGETCQSVYKDYSDKVTKGSFSNVWLYQNWKNIVV